MSRALSSPSARGSHRRRAVALAGAAVALEAAALRHRTSRLAGNVIVRCRSGHLFTTIWVPGVSVKSIRLGLWRVQRCPVGHHFSLVTPVRETDLTDDELLRSREVMDVRLP